MFEKRASSLSDTGSQVFTSFCCHCWYGMKTRFQSASKSCGGATLDGLLGDYMASPYHWGHLDAWYDAENPRHVVDAWLAHVFCPATASVLSG